MQQIWVTNAEMMLEFFNMIGEIEKDFGRELTKDEREIAFIKMMEVKGVKPSGNTELNKQEFINELASKGKKILNIDKDGYTFIEKKEGEKE